MRLDDVLECAARLRDALRTEIDCASSAREALCAFQADVVLREVDRRAGFNARAAALQVELSNALARAGREAGLAQVSVAALRERAPEPAAQFEAVLAEVRQNAAALARLDAANRALAHRAQTIVRGYRNATLPAPAAYDRTGARRASSCPRGSVSTRV